MFIIFIRTFILYTIIIISIRLLGKRQLGEMQPYELAITMLLTDLATLPMQDQKLPLILGIVPITALLLIKTILMAFQVNIPFIRHLLDGEPVILIEDGLLNFENIKLQNLAISDLMEAIRKQGILNIQDVAFCIFENDGNFSFFCKNETVNIDEVDNLPLILFYNGRSSKKNLNKINKDENWLFKKLKPSQDIDNIAIVVMDSNKNLSYQTKDNLEGWIYV